jgi:hypothetical protein
MLRQFCRVLARTNETDQKLLLFMAQKMASANRAQSVSAYRWFRLQHQKPFWISSQS